MPTPPVHTSTTTRPLLQTRNTTLTRIHPPHTATHSQTSPPRARTDEAAKDQHITLPGHRLARKVQGPQPPKAVKCYPSFRTLWVQFCMRSGNEAAMHDHLAWHRRRPCELRLSEGGFRRFTPLACARVPDSPELSRRMRLSKSCFTLIDSQRPFLPKARRKVVLRKS